MPHQIHLSPKEQNRFMYFIHELHDDGGMGEDLLDQAIFLELMVFLNRAFAARCTDAAAPAPAPSSNYHAQVDAILSYINSHICAVFSRRPPAPPSTNTSPQSASPCPNRCSIRAAPSRKPARPAASTTTAIICVPSQKQSASLRKSTRSFTPEVMHVSFVFSHMKRRAQQAR